MHGLETIIALNARRVRLAQAVRDQSGGNRFVPLAETLDDYSIDIGSLQGRQAAERVRRQFEPWTGQDIGEER